MPTSPGLIAQVKASVDLAAQSGAAYILYTEPDKELFFGRLMDEFIDQVEKPDAGVVLASRSDATFATFPRMQRYTEGVINHLCSELGGHGGDYSDGLFLMKRALLRLVADLSADLGWGWRTYLFFAAHRQDGQ